MFVIEKRNIEIVKNALAEGFEDKIISKLTGLTLEQIEKLRDQTNKQITLPNRIGEPIVTVRRCDYEKG